MSFSGAPAPEGKRTEPHTLENLVTHRSQKFWLPRDSLYVRPVIGSREYIREFNDRISIFTTIAANLAI